jgi:hypothetical protein
MHVQTGQTITNIEYAALPPAERSQYVEISGTAEQVARLSHATAHYTAVTGRDRSKRRAVNKAARKARRNNRT